MSWVLCGFNLLLGRKLYVGSYCLFLLLSNILKYVAYAFRVFKNSKIGFVTTGSIRTMVEFAVVVVDMKGALNQCMVVALQIDAAIDFL